jgi:hypothetical protein
VHGLICGGTLHRVGYFLLPEVAVQNSAPLSPKLVPFLFLTCCLAFLSFAPAHSRAQSNAPCPTTTQSGSAGQTNSTLAAEKQNLENAKNQLKSIFKKKPASTPAATTNPCPPAAGGNAPASAAGPGSPARANANASAPAAPTARPTATSGVNWDKPFTPPADVKIEATQLAPYSQSAPFQISPHGTHVTSEVHNGSRVQVVYDGVAGPIFDSFAQIGNTIVYFSPDGSHYGYCGVSGDHMSVMVDGKEVGTTNQIGVNGFDCLIFFSPNSQHFYYISHVGVPATHGSYARFVIDGQQEMDFGDAIPQNFVFSPDGEHFAAVMGPYPPRGTNNQVLVVDGKISNWPGGSPIWSADSQHLFTMGQSGQNQILYRDGQQLMTANNIRLGVQPLNPGQPAPPAGDMPVAIAHNSNGGRGGVLQEEWYLAVNGKQVPGSLIQKTGGSQGNAQITNVFVSQDGKHYAATFVNPNSKQYLFADGKRGLDYDGINPYTVQFTAASAEPVYVATNGGAQYLIVGAQETADANVERIIVGPVGDRVATQGDGGVLDGQPLNLSGNNPLNTQVHAFTFAPDGNNYAYVTFAKATYTLYVNGTPLSGYSWVGSVPDKGPLWTAGNNIAFLCTATGSQYGLCFNGKYTYFGPRPLFNNFTLTPDASHIFFYETTGQGGFRLFLDGVPLLESFYMGAAGFPQGTWEMEPDGRLQILAQDNTGIKRYTITPSSSTSLAMLVGSAGN